MKRTISVLTWILSISLLSLNLNASTTVSSNLISDTQWNQAGSPYLISGNISVPQGVMLTIDHGVQVIFQGTSQLEVDGTLLVSGIAANPAVFNMLQGGLQDKFFLNGGTANILNAKFLGGIFLTKDATLSLDSSEMTQGSGLYLQGVNTVRVKSCKIYGNATGLVSDGKNKITVTFTTIVQNTYGLFLKSFGELNFHNNSIHDNQVEVINNTPVYNLGGNFWGTMDEKAVMAKIQGGIDLKPMKSLKDVLRVYVQSQLPEITEAMSNAMAAKERKEEKAQKLAIKKMKEQEGLEALKAKKAQKAQEKAAQAGAAAPPAPSAVAPVAPAAPVPAAPALAVPGAPALPLPQEAIAPPAPSVTAPAPATAPPSVPYVAETPQPAPAEMAPIPASGTVPVQILPEAAHQLTPVALPNSQGIVSGAPAAAVAPAPAVAPAAAPAAPSAPEAPAAVPPAAPGAVEIPGVPELEVPAAPGTAPAAPAAPGAPEAPAPPPPPENLGVPGSNAAPAIPDSDLMPPPPPSVESVPLPPANVSVASPQPAPVINNIPAGATSAVAAPGGEVPPPPPAAPGSATDQSIPPPPAVQSNTNVPAPLAPAAAGAIAPPPALDNNAVPPPPPASTSAAPAAPAAAPAAQPNTDQKSAVDALQGVNGDIDGMQAPPLDLGVGTSSGNSAAPGAKSSPDSALTLPPLQDSDVKPPKDLDLPPTDDLGNVPLDSRNK